MAGKIFFFARSPEAPTTTILREESDLCGPETGKESVVSLEKAHVCMAQWPNPHQLLTSMLMDGVSEAVASEFAMRREEVDLVPRPGKEAKSRKSWNALMFDADALLVRLVDDLKREMEGAMNRSSFLIFRNDRAPCR